MTQPQPRGHLISCTVSPFISQLTGRWQPNEAVADLFTARAETYRVSLLMPHVYGVDIDWLDALKAWARIGGTHGLRVIVTWYDKDDPPDPGNPRPISLNIVSTEASSQMSADQQAGRPTLHVTFIGAEFFQAYDQDGWFAAMAAVDITVGRKPYHTIGDVLRTGRPHWDPHITGFDTLRHAWRASSPGRVRPLLHTNYPSAA